METKLLALKKGMGKNGKEYYQISVLVGTVQASAFIWQDQYQRILDSLNDTEKKAIVVNR